MCGRPSCVVVACCSALVIFGDTYTVANRVPTVYPVVEPSKLEDAPAAGLTRLAGAFTRLVDLGAGSAAGSVMWRPQFPVLGGLCSCDSVTCTMH
jgi:hypothetical protein